MKNYLMMFAIAGSLAVCSSALAVQNSSSERESAQPIILDNGALMYLELSKSVDAKKAKPGDEVSAILLADVLSHGRIVFLTDSKLLGHVTEAQPHTKEKPESRLGIVFDRIILKGGHEVGLHSMLLALHPAPQLHVEPMSGPIHPGVPGTDNPPDDRHYPIPKGPKTPQISQTMQGELSRNSKAVGDLGETDIEGISLGNSADGNSRVLVSFKRTVKLDSGVRIDLQVTNGAPKKDAPADHAP